MAVDVDADVTRGFGLPAMLPGRWTLLSDDGAAALTARFATTGLRDAALAFDAARVLPLPFYPGWMLCDLRLMDEGQTGHGSERGALAVLYGPDGFTPLDRGLGLLHDHNDRHGITLETPAEALGYLQFAGLFGLCETGPCHVLSPGLKLRVLGAPGAGPDGAFEMPVPEIAMAPSAPGSALDKVRAPEAARIAADVIEADRLRRITYRLSSAGEITVLAAKTLADCIALRPEIRFSGAMRFCDPGRPGRAQ